MTRKFILSLLILSLAFGCGKPLYKSKQVMMGTFVEVVSPDERAAKIAFAEIKRVENLLSCYITDSEVSRLNRDGQIKASPETIYVVRRAGEFYLASSRVFDITIGPLMELWGFRDNEHRVPSDEEIQITLGKIGFDKVQISDNIIKFKTRGVKIDLGGIAKGFAVDCAIDKLREAGIESALINAGGDIYCLGDKAGRPWKVAIRNPRSSGAAGYLEIKDKAVATSGNYEQYFVHRGIRYTHIIDPRSGKPVKAQASSTTVIASDCLTADALATSTFILGKERGEKLAQQFKAQLITK